MFVMTIGGRPAWLSTVRVESGTWWIDARTNKLLGHSAPGGGTDGSLGLLTGSVIGISRIYQSRSGGLGGTLGC